VNRMTKAAMTNPTSHTAAMAQTIYAAFGYEYAGAMTDIKGQPMGAWRNALQAATDLQEASLAPWRDIARAPTDGTPVDLWRDGERMTDFHWNAGMARWEKQVGYPARTIALTATPTHWMPVPPAAA